MKLFNELSVEAKNRINNNVFQGRPHEVHYDVDSTARRVGVMVDYIKPDGRMFFQIFYFDFDGFHTKSTPIKYID